MVALDAARLDTISILRFIFFARGDVETMTIPFRRGGISTEVADGVAGPGARLIAPRPVSAGYHFFFFLSHVSLLSSLFSLRYSQKIANLRREKGVLTSAAKSCYQLVINSPCGPKP